MHRQLKQIYEEDASDRNYKIPDEELDNNDRIRMIRIQKMLDDTQNLEAQDFHHAALIFQHGKTANHYKKAHELAMKAVELGDDSARWLAAASLDRSLLMENKAQKYGTQFTLNEKNEWELALPINPTVTDEERAEWNVPPLKDALKVWVIYKN